MRLSKAQRKRLIFIRDYKPENGSIEVPGFWKSSITDKTLVRHELIEVFDKVFTHRGGMRFKVDCCRITDAGRAALKAGEEG